LEAWEENLVEKDLSMKRESDRMWERANQMIKESKLESVEMKIKAQNQVLYCKNLGFYI